MSGFQIPGLGFAKPNETLPPLPADGATTAASVENVEAVKDDASKNNDDKQTQAQNEDTKMEDEPTLPELPVPIDHEPMSIDAAEPPSLTDALEAMINGLDPTPPAPQITAAAVTATKQPETAPAAAPATDAAPAAPTAEQQPAGEGEHPEWEVDSSPYESSSDDSSSDSSSDDDSESGEGYKLLGIEETARLLMEMDNGSDDEVEGSKAGASIVRSRNEMLPEVIPKPDITLTPEDKIEQLGVVDQIVDNIMVIKAFTPGEYQVLDSGSALCTEDRKIFGTVWETIGKVVQPMYTVMFNTAGEIKEAGLEVGSKVCYPTAHATFVFTEPLKNLKGSDASNIHDEEVGDEEMEFSDDEKELEHKRQVKQKKRDARAKNGGGERRAQKPHPLRNEIGAGSSADGALNYDDDEEGPYKPLARPPGFGQVPPTQQTYGEEPEPGPVRFGSRRGGGRGDFKGRGDRGRGGRGRGRGGPGQRDSRDGYSMPQQRPQQSQQAQGQWGGSSYQPPAQQSAPPPAAPAFNFPVPFPPPQPGQGFPAVPPPPPGWPAQGGQTGQNQAGAYINPAFFAALLGQMQQQQQSQQQNAQQQPQQPGQNNQQQPPQQPPNQWGAQQQQPPR